MGTAIYRPPQWGLNTTPITITVPANYVPAANNSPASLNSTATLGSVVSGDEATIHVASNTTASVPVVYVFDAVMELDHDQQLRMTEHPVQTGADISSHAYLMPATLSMSILMSDSVDQYANTSTNTTTVGASTATKATPWTGSPSKSVSAYQQMIALQAARVPLIISTRLRTYYNMMVTNVQAPEDYRSYGGVRMRLSFGQIRTATISQSQPVVSARTQDTDNTPLGSVTPIPVPAATTQQFNINNYGGVVPVKQSQVQGAGNYSSSNTLVTSSITNALSSAPGVY
jgi:hypothetical protein